MEFDLWMLGLQHFGEGGEGGGAGATGGMESGTDAASQRAEGAEAPSGADAAGQRDLAKEWQKMINGEFKEYFSRDTQRIIDKRFKAQKTSEEAEQKYRTLAEKVSARYGADADNMDALIAAIDGDKAFVQEQADKMGMTRDQYMDYVQNKQQALKYQQLMDQRRQEAEQAQKVAAWEAEAEALAQKYPAFNLDAELGNKHFTDMIRKGISMEHAYKMLHYDEHMQDMARYSAQTAEKETVDRIRARGMRPQEGAMGATAAVQQTTSAKNLTKADREKLYNEIVFGRKKVTFG